MFWITCTSAIDCPRKPFAFFQPPMKRTREHFVSAFCDPYPLYTPSCNKQLGKNCIWPDITVFSIRIDKRLGKKFIWPDITVFSIRITGCQFGCDGVTNQTSLERKWIDFVIFVFWSKVKILITACAQVPRIVAFVYTSIWPILRSCLSGLSRPLPSGEVWQQFPWLSQISITARQLLPSYLPVPVLMAILHTWPGKGLLSSKLAGLTGQSILWC